MSKLKKLGCFIIIIVLALGSVYFYFQHLKPLKAKWNSGEFADITNQVADITQELVQDFDVTQDENSFFFLVVGDNEGVNPVFEQIVTETREGEAVFLIHVGDVTARGMEEDYQQNQELLDSMGKPYYIAIGNNDLDKNDKSNDRFKQYFGEETYYSFDYQNAHFIILDNAERTVGFDNAQLEWLEQDLQNNTQDFTFIFFHRSVNVPFSNIFGDDETPRSRKSIENLIEILKEYPVDQIYSGHVHTYLSYDIEDTPAIITGGGGALPQSIMGGEKSAYYHYIKVTVTEDEFSNEVFKIE